MPIMTEGLWLSLTDPINLWYAKCARHPRKRRLVSCACARRVLMLLTDDPRPLALIEACERFADAPDSGSQTAWKAVVTARRGLWAFQRAHERDTSEEVAALTRRAFAIMALSDASARNASAGVSVFGWANRALNDAETAFQLAIIREVFGNPFRPVAFSPAWRTDTAVSLARAMYESREFGAMPILADALQDAGCDNADVLNHCRDTSLAHIRGCWVVDLVLGKE